MDLSKFYRQIKIFDYEEMANRGTTKYLLPEYMSYVRNCIVDASVSMQIKWFERVEQLFKQVHSTSTSTSNFNNYIYLKYFSKKNAET